MSWNNIRKLPFYSFICSKFLKNFNFCFYFQFSVQIVDISIFLVKNLEHSGKEKPEMSDTLVGVKRIYTTRSVASQRSRTKKCHPHLQVKQVLHGCQLLARFFSSDEGNKRNCSKLSDHHCLFHGFCILIKFYLRNRMEVGRMLDGSG